MSDYFISNHKKAYNRVGGSDISDLSFVKKQNELLKNEKDLATDVLNDKIPTSTVSYGDIVNYAVNGMNTASYYSKKKENDNYDKYNPYHEYLKRKGINDDVKIRILTSHINIDSKTRSVNPRIVYDDAKVLESNPLYFESTDLQIGINVIKQNNLIIKCPNHGLLQNDRIILQGIENKTYTIKNIFSLNNTTVRTVLFTQDSFGLAFICNYVSNSSVSFIPNFSIGTGISYDELKKYDTSNMYVNLSGFDISDYGTSQIGNIPINFLNGNHQIYFTNPDTSQIELVNIPSIGMVNNIDGFYIKLPKTFSGTVSTNVMNISMTFNHIGGIPINKLNAEFPVDNDHVNGYHIIESITKDTITIKLDKPTYYYKKINYNDTLINENILFGGNDVSITKINNIISGYSSPSNYKIELPKLYKNVFQIKIINSAFPNVSRTFDKYNKYNTKIYWQIQNDGDYVYVAEIPSGNYSSMNLSNVITKQINSIDKQYYNTDVMTNYSNKNYMEITIDEITNTTTFYCYNLAFVINPIIFIEQSDNKFTLTILQLNHGLSVGQIVKFENFIDTNIIPSKYLNTEHIVTFILSDDKYNIEILNINVLTTSIDTMGGYECKILVPLNFRLLFTYNDTMGKELGFRNVGYSTSITKFNSVISNLDSYDNEFILIDDNIKYIKDESGLNNILTNNSLNLCSDDIVYLYVREFGNIKTYINNDIIDIFNKIFINGDNKIIYNSFMDLPCIQTEPIDLTELNISFFNEKGNLYNFYGREHNFIIELSHIDYSPTETNIVSNSSPY